MCIRDSNKIDNKGVYVDLGFKFEGFIAIDEFAEVPGFEPDQLNIGDEVEAMVVKVSDKDGEAILSKRRVDNKKNMLLLEQSFESKTPVTVRIKEAVNGGVVAYLGSCLLYTSTELRDPEGRGTRQNPGTEFIRENPPQNR